MARISGSPADRDGENGDHHRVIGSSFTSAGSANARCRIRRAVAFLNQAPIPAALQTREPGFWFEITDKHVGEKQSGIERHVR